VWDWAPFVYATGTNSSQKAYAANRRRLLGLYTTQCSSIHGEVTHGIIATDGGLNEMRYPTDLDGV